MKAKRYPRLGDRFQKFKGEPLGTVVAIMNDIRCDSDGREVCRGQWIEVMYPSGTLGNYRISDLTFSNGKWWRLTTAAIASSWPTMSQDLERYGKKPGWWN